MGTHWLGEDFLRPLPQRINRQRPPCRPDFHVGTPFGGILFRDRHKSRELLTVERQQIAPAHERAPERAVFAGVWRASRF